MSLRDRFQPALVVAAVFVLATAATARADQTPANPAAEIRAKAAEYGYRTPRPESPQPRRTPAPRNTGAWQAFAGPAWVYWTPSAGAHLIPERIFTTYARQRWEQGPLGFPITDELTPRASDPVVPGLSGRDRYQLFEGGMITWQAATGRAVVHVRAHRSAAFRVTLTGFRVTRRTADDPLRRDGADDEVYLTSTSTSFDGRNRRVRGTRTRSRVIGDIHDRPDRILGGSSWDVFGGNGGFTSGDAFPDRHPERISRPLRDAAPPSPLFAGTLVQGESSLITIPEIWEWDDHPAQPPQDGTTTLLLPPSTPGFLRVLRGTRVNAIELPAVLRRQILRPASAAGLAPEPFMAAGTTDGTRPIGLDDTGADGYTRNPTAITLTYDLAELAARTNFGYGPGVVRIRYTDPPGLDGDYTLYLRIQRVN